jgi:DNA-binding response OmpR family regulator
LITGGKKHSRRGTMAQKILVVDDEPTIRDFLNDFFTEEGYKVLQASNGEQAILLAEIENPEVILLDIHMPGIDGIEVCKRLKAQKKTRYIPIIIITGLDDRGFIAYLEGADDFVTKPFNPVELTFRVRSMHRIRRLNTELLLAQGYIGQLEKELFELRQS